jgi:hypothetical protein
MENISLNTNSIKYQKPSKTKKDKICLQKEEERKRKANKVWLFGLPKWKKTKSPKQLAAQQDPSK